MKVDFTPNPCLLSDLKPGEAFYTTGYSYSDDKDTEKPQTTPNICLKTNEVDAHRQWVGLVSLKDGYHGWIGRNTPVMRANVKVVEDN